MPRYYCDYCDTYLTHDSPSVRKQHNAGYKHKANVRQYYQQFEEQQTQSLIDQRIKEHLGQAAYQVGATYLSSLPPNAQRPRLPVLPTPVLPMPGGSQPPLPLMRPPVLPRPMPGAPGYGGMPGMQFPGPPGPPSGPMQMNGPPRPPITPPASSGGPSAPIPGFNPATYQGNPSAGGGGGYDAFSASSPSGMQRSAQDGPPPSNAPQDGGHHMYSQPSESNH
ncbi:unnamed protein product [Spirodela intermedia]|uniref:U1 small nuclear ribonucleoprotein C n=1 Tax=Spirodela intermedia TaxID=51605 RepID=A0A7I8KQU4_SPIIN|nr:unnamed protein product [Spirodela intermedia]